MQARSQKWLTAACRELAPWTTDFTAERASQQKRTLVFASTEVKNDSAVVVPIHWVTSSHSNKAIMTMVL